MAIGPCPSRISSTNTCRSGIRLHILYRQWGIMWLWLSLHRSEWCSYHNTFGCDNIFIFPQIIDLFKKDSCISKCIKSTHAYLKLTQCNVYQLYLNKGFLKGQFIFMINSRSSISITTDLSKRYVSIILNLRGIHLKSFIPFDYPRKELKSPFILQYS